MDLYSTPRSLYHYSCVVFTGRINYSQHIIIYRVNTSMIYETRTRSLVKTVIYRIWVLATTYIMLLVTGQTLASAVVPTLIINAVWMTSFYLYDRIWARITWGRC